ncbi:thioredoxin family protein [Desulfosporosinus sp. SB140]|uniref:thioredoxin family protein n=1 Tax=Desulfosporosinus paludis TaxID=3115649 RepID=UPI00388EEA0D
MLNVDKENFEAEVLLAEQPVLVDFWGPKCEKCLAMMPDVEVLSQEYGGKVKFCKMDASKNRRLAISQKVLGLPSIVLYRKGERILHLVEDMSVESVRKALEEFTKGVI